MHTAVNPLAGEEHLKEVIQQLQLMGEVSLIIIIIIITIIILITFRWCTSNVTLVMI